MVVTSAIPISSMVVIQAKMRSCVRRFATWYETKDIYAWCGTMVTYGRRCARLFALYLHDKCETTKSNNQVNRHNVAAPVTAFTFSHPPILLSAAPTQHATKGYKALHAMKVGSWRASKIQRLPERRRHNTVVAHVSTTTVQALLQGVCCKSEDATCHINLQRPVRLARQNSATH
jgi:hypothetical protein